MAYFVIPIFWDAKFTVASSLGLTMLYTPVSIVRNYPVRRFFNKKSKKSIDSLLENVNPEEIHRIWVAKVKEAQDKHTTQVQDNAQKSTAKQNQEEILQEEYDNAKGAENNHPVSARIAPIPKQLPSPSR